MVPCPNCGKSVAEGIAHCGHCGHKMDVENKKTMMGMPAINPDDLQGSIAEAKSAASAPAAEPKPTLPTPGGGASSGSGGEFSLPRPSSTGEALAETNSEDPDAKTLMLPQIRKEDGSQRAKDPMKDTWLDSQPEVTHGLPSTDGAGESAAAPTGPMEAAPAGENFPNFSDDAFAETMAGQSGDDLAAQHTAHTAGRGTSETPVEFAPTLEGTAPPSLIGGPMPGAPVPDGMAAGAPAGPGLEPFASAPEMSVQPMVQSAGGGMIPAATEGKSNKKMFIIIGVIVALLFGCCIVGTIINSFVLPMISAASL